MAGGGARRPELISEAEARRDNDDLDFDSGTFDGFVPGEGAPGPEQAPLWEDVEQPESEIAAALHMELAELRALRTPVPTRPSGVAHVVAPQRDTVRDEPDDDAPPTNKVPRASTAEVYGDDDIPTQAVPSLEPAKLPLPAPAASQPVMPASASASLPFVPKVSGGPKPEARGPSVGAAFLARSSGPSKLLWIVAAMLGVAVLAVVAYIVMK